MGVIFLGFFTPESMLFWASNEKPFILTCAWSKQENLCVLKFFQGAICKTGCLDNFDETGSKCPPPLSTMKSKCKIWSHMHKEVRRQEYMPTSYSIWLQNKLQCQPFRNPQGGHGRQCPSYPFLRGARGQECPFNETTYILISLTMLSTMVWKWLI